MRRIARFLESGPGVASSWLILILLIATTGWQAYRDWPRGKPASMLHADIRVVDGGLLLTTTILKSRVDCSFSGDRWAERDGEYIGLGGARAQWITTPGKTTLAVKIDLPDDIAPGSYIFRTAGAYQCPEGLYPADPIEVPFTIPALSAPIAR